MSLLFAVVTILLATSNPVWGDGLNDRARKNGLHYFGTEVSTEVLNDAAANAIAVSNAEFGAYTCEYEQKFAYTEPSRNNFSYSISDRIVNQALKNNMIMRCHNLVWYQSLPTWVTDGNFNNATLIQIMVNHITNVVTHFKGKCYAWDVVNEAIYADGTFRGETSASYSVWYETIGPAYIPIAFAAAAAADPAAKMYYNDYSIEAPGTKATGALNLVKMVQAHGARIDGVGLQAHFATGYTPSQAHLVSSLKAFAALGVEVAYTELDISTPIASPNYAQQEKDYVTVVGACQQVPQCVGISVWGFTDKYTWIAGSYPDLWNVSLQKKPVYYTTLAQLGPVPAS